MTGSLDGKPGHPSFHKTGGLEEVGQKDDGKNTPSKDPVNTTPKIEEPKQEEDVEAVEE